MMEFFQALLSKKQQNSAYTSKKEYKISFSHIKFIEYQRSNLISDHLFCWLRPNFCITWHRLGIRQVMHNYFAFTKQQDWCEIFVISIPLHEHIYMSYPLKLTHQHSRELQILMLCCVMCTSTREHFCRLGLL